MSRRLIAGLALTLGLCASINLHAVVLSAKSLGMAGTGVAYAQDALAAGLNPAGASDIGNRFDLGATWVHFHGKTVTKGNLNPLVNGSVNGFYNSRNVITPDFGLNYNFDCNWSAGIVSYNRNYLKTTYEKPNLLLSRTGKKPGLEYMHQTVSPYVAYKYGCMSFGVSVNWMIQRIKINGLQNFANARLSRYPNYVTNEGYNYSNGIGFTFGWLWHFNDCFSLGLTFQPETKMSRFGKYKGLLARAGKFNIPQKIGAGISWRFVPCATFTFDVENIRWNHIQAIHNKLLNDEGELNLLGASNGPGFGWRNQTYFRFGLDYAWNDDLTLRCGFRHATELVRKSQTAINVLTLETVQDLITLGATYRIGCSDEISAFYVQGFDKQVKGRASIPVFLGGGNANLKEGLFALGLSWGHDF